MRGAEDLCPANRKTHTHTHTHTYIKIGEPQHAAQAPHQHLSFAKGEGLRQKKGLFF